MISTKSRCLSRPERADLDLLGVGAARLPEVLKQFGFQKMRPGQSEAVLALLSGKDVFCILPTACHAKGQMLLMWDGSLKAVENIVVGDLLMGPDSMPRQVIQLHRGRELMVRVIPFKGKPFEVNNSHILTLVNTNNNLWVDVRISDWKNWDEEKKQRHNLVRVRVKYRKFTPSPPEEISRSGFTIVDLKEDEYYGFSLSGDGRYLMDDFTVTHNTGKSFAFVAPALCHNWPTLVFSPLVALMQDQVASLWKKGVAARALSGLNSPAENAESLRSWANGETQILYLAPERLANPDFIEAIRKRRPEFVVLDEAHCMSQWGYNFRSSYCEVGDFVAQWNPRVIGAFTATAPTKVEADVRKILGIHSATRVVYYPKRDYISLQVTYSNPDTEVSEIAKILRKFSSPDSGCAIVYSATIRRAEETAVLLAQLEPDLRVGVFHSELKDSQKHHMLRLFMEGGLDVISATCAFGLGIDKPDVRCVLHRDIPGSPEAYVQEFGRACRDGKPGVAVLMYGETGVRQQRSFIDSGHPDRRDIARVFNYLKTMEPRPGGKIFVTRADVSRATGIFKYTVDSIYEILKASGVIEIETLNADEKLMRLRLNGDSPVADNVYFQKLLAAFNLPSSGGEINATQDELAAACGRTWGTVSAHIRALEKAGAIQVISKAYRGKPPVIVGDLSYVDFEALAFKREQAEAGLQSMIDYAEKVDPAKRHEYLEKMMLERVMPVHNAF